MNVYKSLLLFSLGAALLSMTSCYFSKDEIKAIVRKEAGKDDFRDSEKWGKVVTKELDLADFTHINVSGKADVKVVQGDTVSVEVQGNEYAIENNVISVEDGILFVARKKKAPHDTPIIKVTVTVPTLESVNVSGASDIDFKKAMVFDNDLRINLSGAGDLNIDKSIFCHDLTIAISGAGDITAKKLQCRKADILISGAGDLEADIDADDISLSISGAGDADLKVLCKNLDVSASGTGDVELEGECTSLTKHSSGAASIDSRNLTVKKMNIR